MPLALGLLACRPQPRDGTTEAPATEVDALADLHWQRTLDRTPEVAYFMGIPIDRHDGLADNSAAALERARAEDDELLEALERVDPDRLADTPQSGTYGILREELSVAANPDGAACYQALLRLHTPLDRSPEEVFELGSQTVEKNRMEIIRLGAARYGSEDFGEIVRCATENPQDRFSTSLEVLDFSVDAVSGMVVDPGIHAMGWTREHAGELVVSSGRIPAELGDQLVDLAASIPGQLTVYDSGAIEIFALRRLAEERLGAAFDVREFHDQVLEGGALPLLRRHVKLWLSEQARRST